MIVTRCLEEPVDSTKPLHEIDRVLPFCFVTSIEIILCSEVSEYLRGISLDLPSDGDTSTTAFVPARQAYFARVLVRSRKLCSCPGQSGLNAWSLPG